MSSILDTLNNLILKTYGGLLAFWALALYFFIKLLHFMGGCLAEGAINRGIIKIIPIVRNQFKQEFNDLREKMSEMDSKMSEMDSKLSVYKKEKHVVDNENVALKQVVLSSDEELLVKLKDLLKNETK